MKLHSLVRMLVVFQVPGHTAANSRWLHRWRDLQPWVAPGFVWRSPTLSPCGLGALASINEHMLPLGHTLRMKMDPNNEIFYEVSGREVPFSARLE